MSLRPWYNQEANYQTNAKSFMDYLARTNKFLEVLIEDYEIFQELVIEELERIKFDSEMAVDDILVNWLEDGTLARIINDGVLGNKADKSFVEDELEKVKTLLTQANENLEQTNKNLTQANKNIEVIKHKQSKYVSVTDFGAVGDGVTNDTVAVQNAINSLANTRGATLIFPATNGDAYILDTLTIPSSMVVVEFLGIGTPHLKFNTRIGFNIQTESVFFKEMKFSSEHTQRNNEGSVMFKDDRQYKQLDFDLQLKDCTVTDIYIVVETKGRGVILDSCYFGAISGLLIRINVQARSNVTEGSQDIQTYEKGYRVYIIKNCRLHYLTNARMIEVIGDSEKVLNHVKIENNDIEGGTGYFTGYCEDLSIKNNQHTNGGYPWGQLVILHGGKNVNIEFNLNSMLTIPTYTSPLYIDGYVINLTVTGSVSGLKHHLVNFFDCSSQNVNIDVNVTNVLKVDFSPFYINFSGSNHTHNGHVYGGIFQGTDVTRPLIQNEGTNIIFKNIKNELLGIGEYSVVSTIVST